jgi:transcriptional regulator with AAA-type ATPase domain/tetratricopeptide (TPR) repeat protein
MERFPLSEKLSTILAEIERLRIEQNWSALVQLAHEALNLLSETHNRERASVTFALSNALTKTGKFDEAWQILFSIRSLLDRIGDEEIRGLWHLDAGSIAYRRGQLDTAEKHAFSALVSAELLGDHFWIQGSAHGNIGLICMQRCEWRPAERHLLESIKYFTNANDSRAANHNRVNLAVTLYWAGEWSRAVQVGKIALDQAIQLAAGRTAVRAHLVLGMLARVRNDASAAEAHLTAAREAATARDDQRELALADELAGDLALDAGNLERAAECYSETIATGLRIAPRGDLVYEGQRKLSEVRLRQGNVVEAQGLAAEALALARAAGTVVEIGASLRALALAERALGDIDAARTHAGEALAVLRTVHERYERLQTLIATADLFEERQQLLTEARGLASELGLETVLRNIDSQLASAAVPAADTSVKPTHPPAQIHRLTTQKGGVFLTTDLRIVSDIELASRNDNRVLIEGESGTGKELVARLVHERSGRAKGPFVAVECTSLHEALAQSELFGHVKGAFTGAVADRKGLVEVAQGGTLFLDEIGDLPLTLQGRLLRLLQERELRPVGSSTTRTVDVRVVAATNRSLNEEVQAGRFRRDLYYRIRGAVVRVPPLRERPSDIRPLIQHYLAVYGAHYNKSVSFGDAAERVFMRYSWPGNVRQLEYEIENLVARLDDGAEIAPSMVSADILAGAMSGRDAPDTFRMRMDTALIEEVQRALRATGGNRQRTADMLGFSRRGLQKLLKRLGLVEGTIPMGKSTGKKINLDEDMYS